jgi:hypothetical protein
MRMIMKMDHEVQMPLGSGEIQRRSPMAVSPEHHAA